MSASASSVSGSLISEALAYLKQYVDSVEIANVMLKEGALFGLIAKDFDISGQGGNIGGTLNYPSTTQGGYPVPIITSGGASPSANVTAANNNQAPARTSQFQVPMQSFFNFVTLSRTLARASRNNPGAFLEAAKVECDAALRSLAQMTSRALYSNTNGIIGQINGSGVNSAGAIVLASPADAVNFQPDTALNAYTMSGGVLTQVNPSTPGSPNAFVVSVDRSLGIIYVSSTQGGTPGQPSMWGPGNYLIGDGNANAQIAGVLTYVPDQPYLRPAPNLPSTINYLFGVDRSKDVVGLAGNVIQAQNESIEDTLIDLVSEVNRAGGGIVDTIFMNPISVRALTKEMTSRRHYVMDVATGPTGISFPAIVLSSDTGPVKVVGDRWAPAKRAFALQMEDWEMVGYEDYPNFLDYMDGLDWLRTSGDASQARLGGDINVTCKAPGHQGVAILNQ